MKEHRLHILSTDDYFFFYTTFEKAPFDWKQAAKSLVKTRFPGNLDTCRLYWKKHRSDGRLGLSVLVVDMLILEACLYKAVSAAPWVLEGLPRDIRFAWHGNGEQWESWQRNDLDSWEELIDTEVPAGNPQKNSWILEHRGIRRSFTSWNEWPFIWRLRSPLLEDPMFKQKVKDLAFVGLWVQSILAGLWILFSFSSLIIAKTPDLTSYENEWKRLTDEKTEMQMRLNEWNTRIERLPGVLLSEIMVNGKLEQDRLLRVRQATEEFSVTFEGNDPYATLQLWLRNKHWKDVTIGWPEASKRSVFTLTAKRDENEP